MQFRRAVVAVALLLAPANAFADRHREDMFMTSGPLWGSKLYGFQAGYAFPIKEHSNWWEGSIMLGGGYYAGKEDDADVTVVPVVAGIRWSWWCFPIKGQQTHPMTQILLGGVRREEVREGKRSTADSFGMLFSQGFEWDIGRGVRARIQGDLAARRSGGGFRWGKGITIGVSVGLD